MILPDKIKLYFDGSYNETIRVMSGGWIINDDKEKNLLYWHGVMGRGQGSTTSEWLTLFLALNFLNSVNWRGGLVFYTDCKNITNSLNHPSKHKVRAASIRPLYLACKTILDQFNWEALHVSREDNWICHLLSQCRSDELVSGLKYAGLGEKIR